MTIKIHKLCISLIVLLAMLMSNAVIAAEQNISTYANVTTTLTNEKSIAQDTTSSTSVISQFIAAFEAIKFKLQHLFDIDVIAAKVMAIIHAIELQCKNLAELVTGPPSPSDSEKLNTIINNVENQRQSLWDIILPSADDTNASTDAYIANLDNKNKDNSFKVYAK